VPHFIRARERLSLEMLGSDTARPGSGRFDAPRALAEYQTGTRGAGERFTTRTLKGCALVLWAICESADATRKKNHPPSPFERAREVQQKRTRGLRVIQRMIYNCLLHHECQ